MNSKMIFMDPEVEWGDEYFPDLHDIKINSHGEKLIGIMLTPGKKGPNPTVILLHGFPGYEDNHDLSHSLRRCGLNVLTFHYRGCWGVRGKFTFSNCIEDVNKAIDFVTNEDNIKTYDIDRNNIFLVGHSMGGFLTLINCTDKRIKASVSISPYDFGLKGCLMKENEEELRDGINMFSTAILPLNDTDTMALIRETIINGDDWKLSNKAEQLSKENILIIAARGDIVGPNKLHHIPLMKEIYKYNENNVKEIFMSTDHSYSNKRILLSKVVAEYIESIYKDL
ncbi:alpha/beta hydrolase family protein [Terrisporobacter mayombei]|uniref:BD-FAE-like domain-containing protein n=1 Tax=Terrisporobacter mayombei TaxID=1541 RepID=A0ABY9Q2M9_9FIRM|nr:alpha/beta fold hydrolase [Terrisporobacter mayombei]MCC3867474.1 alpha/beta fold hydrolase [Terrisporobacter mayombei]WMT81733.1 hypothetical protein TEMA_20810 [Terrisporobacter mayombei]